MSEEKKLNIDWDVCLKLTVLVVFLYFLYLVKDIVIWFIFALVLAILFNFPIDFLERKKFPRVVATIIVYFGILIILSFFFFKTAPVFLLEIKQFSSNLPYYLQKISPYFEKIGIRIIENPQSFFSLLENNLEKAGQNILNALSVIFGGMGATLFIVFLAFFLSLEKNFLERILSNFAPTRYQQYLFNLLPRVRKKVSGWFLSRIIGVLFVGIISYLVLMILNVKYAFILSVIAGLLDFIPYIGPIIAGIIITFIVMIISFGQALFVLISFIIIQQLEGNLLIPILQKRIIGIPPALVLVALIVGAKLWGFLGAILAVPLAAVIFELIKDYLKLKRKEEEREGLREEAAQTL